MSVHYSVKESSKDYVEANEFFYLYNRLYIDDNRAGIVDNKKTIPFLDYVRG